MRRNPATRLALTPGGSSFGAGRDEGWLDRGSRDSRAVGAPQPVVASLMALINSCMR